MSHDVEVNDASGVFDPPALVTVAVNSWRPQACGGTVVNDTLYIVGGRGKNYMLVTKDGRTFEDVHVEPGSGLRGILVEGDRAWIVGESGTLLQSQDGRKTFTSIDTGVEGCLYTVTRQPDGDIWIGGDDGYLARLRGEELTTVAGIDGNVNQLISTPLGFLAATSTGLFRIENGEPVATSLKHPLHKVVVTAAGSLLAVGHENAAFRSTDGGKTFSASKVPAFQKTVVPPANQRDLASWETPQQGLCAAAQLPDGALIVSGEQGVVLCSNDDGATFTRVAHDRSESGFEVAFAFRGAIYVGGDHHVVLRLRPIHARPGRPAAVPPSAVYDPKESEWLLGARNAEGEPVGVCKYWLEDGHLVCDAAYDDRGRLKSLVRFHPDGTEAQRVSYVDGLAHGVAYYQRSRSPSPEMPIPYEAPANVFRMEYVWNEGKVESTRLWDVNGDEVDSDGDIIRPLRRGDVAEEATFDAENKVWVLQPFDEAGDPHGVARWWRPSGTLIEEHQYEHGRPVYQRRFHPHGAVAFERLYSDKTHIPTMNTRWATDQPTDIDFPRRGLAPSIVKTQYVYDAHGYIDHWIGWDKDGNEITRESVNRSLDATTEQASFASVEEAAAEWNAKGDAFYAALNAFIAQNYVTADEDDSSGDDDSSDDDDEEHPTDERGHMERFVLRAIEKLSAMGPGRARAMFKPSFEPFGEAVWKLGKTIHKVCALPGKLIIGAGDEVYVVANDMIERQADVRRFGVSRDKRYLAHCYDDRIDVVDRERGAKVHTLAYPKNWGEKVMKDHPDLRLDAFNSWKALRIADILVGNDGGFVVLVTERGIFLLQPTAMRLLFPPPEATRCAKGIPDVIGETEGGASAFDLTVNQPRAALSLDEETLVMSGDYGPYDPVRVAYVFGARQGDGAYTQEDTWSSGPWTPSHFHSNGKHYLAGMVERKRGFFGAAGSTESLVFTFDAAYVREQKTSLLEGARTHSMRSAELTAVTELEDRFLIGMTDSYVWSQGIDENTQQYLFCGLDGTYGEITCLEVSENEVFIGTNYGAVWRLSLSDKPGEGFITNMNLRDERRYLFLDTFGPMIW